MKENIVRDKSIAFAKRVVLAYRYLCEEKNEFTLSKQFLRSGTSIGANVVEAQHGSSRKDFLNKLYIALKECVETLYWLELLASARYLTEKEYVSMQKDCTELQRLLTSIIKTTKQSL